MSLTQVRNVVLLFSNPVWGGANTVPTTIIRNITALSSDLAYEDTSNTNLTTLTVTNAETLNGVIQGLLYVPDIPKEHPCYEKQYDLIPRNVTTQAQLPPTNYNLVALAPWFNASCTLAYLESARLDPIRAFIFYRPNNATSKPQPVSSPIWDLGDDGAWQTDNHFPIFAIPGQDGANMMMQLSFYSGNVTSVPHGGDIATQYTPNEEDYIRIWTELTIKDPGSIPAMWTFFVIVVGAILFLVTVVSLMMHLVQRRRRKDLRKRILNGEVDLEAMGIKRLTVPRSHVQDFPLFTYCDDPELASIPPSPVSPRGPRSPRSPRRSDLSSRPFSDAASQGGRTTRSNNSGKTEATNFQPNCHICLERFKHRVSIIRELPCQHIFHPECIDEFLSQNSSLCPMCKRSMLPRGYCPRITNGIVRRERAIRRLRERVIVDDSDSEKSKDVGWGKRFWLSRALTMNHHSSETAPHQQQQMQQEPQSEMPLAPLRSAKPPQRSRESLVPRSPIVPMETVPESPCPSPEPVPLAETSTADTTPATTQTAESTSSSAATPPPQQMQQVRTSPVEEQPAKRGRFRRRRPRELKFLPPPTGQSLAPHQPDGQLNPSAQTRQRMRTLAGSPFYEIEGERPRWKRALFKVFPGFS